MVHSVNESSNAAMESFHLKIKKNVMMGTMIKEMAAINVASSFNVNAILISPTNDPSVEKFIHIPIPSLNPYLIQSLRIIVEMALISQFWENNAMTEIKIPTMGVTTAEKIIEHNATKAQEVYQCAICHLSAPSQGIPSISALSPCKQETSYTIYSQSLHKP